jgi:hypothetical protein
MLNAVQENVKCSKKITQKYFKLFECVWNLFFMSVYIYTHTKIMYIYHVTVPEYDAVFRICVT